MKRINFFSFVLISLLLILFPLESASADEERSLDPEDLERSLYSFQSYQGDKWYFDAIDTPNSNNNGANVTIAILDTGVTKTPQLACHNFVSEYDAFWDISGPGSARDIGSHGTLVAHTIADCDIGIAKSVNIMPVRIFTDAYASYGYPSYTDDLAIAMGIVWAVDNGADIINMSFGRPCYSTYEDGCKGDKGSFAGYVDGAIKYAYDNNVLLIAASGNSALPWVSYPANNPYVWAIGAVNTSLNKASFSDFGSALDFVAPGENIGTALGTVQGTSFSSPEVAAAAAVLKGSMPGLTVEEIEGAFICTVVDLGDAGWDPEYGWGMIQIKASLDLLNAGLLQTPWFPTPTLTLVSEGQGKIKAMWQPADDCNDIDSYSLYKNGEFINSYNKNNTEGYVTVTESGTYSLSVRATNVFSNNTELITASIDIDLTPPQWDEGALIIIAQQNDTLVYSWPSAQDESGISNYALRVERDGELVIQENTISTSLSFSLGYFENPGTYSVSLKVFDEFNNENELSTGFIIEDTTTTTTSTTTTTTIPTSEEDNSSTTTTSTTTTTLPSFNSVTTTTTIPVFDTTTTTTVPITVTANTDSELVGCISNSQIGESAVRLWIINTTSLDAYFDVRYSTNSGITWTDLRDGEFISSSAAYMFLTPNLSNNTRVQWQWRGGLENPNSGNYSFGPSITVSGCPVSTSGPTTTTTTSTTTTTIDTTPPYWPGGYNPSIDNVSDSSISVSWIEPSDNAGVVSNYRIYLNNELINTVDSSVRTYTFNNLNSGFSYTIKIEASDSAGNWSNSVTAQRNTVSSTVPILNSFSVGSFTRSGNDSIATINYSFIAGSDTVEKIKVWYQAADTGHSTSCTVNIENYPSSYNCQFYTPNPGQYYLWRIEVYDSVGRFSIYGHNGSGSANVVPNSDNYDVQNGVSTHNFFGYQVVAFTVETPTPTVPILNSFSVGSFTRSGNDSIATINYSFIAGSDTVEKIKVWYQAADTGHSTSCTVNIENYPSSYNCQFYTPNPGQYYLWRIEVYDSVGRFSIYGHNGSGSAVVVPNNNEFDVQNGVSTHNFFGYQVVSFTVYPSISANTSSELVGCLTGDDAGKSKVRLWVTNTSGVDAYFDVQYSTNNGSSWTTLGDGEFISNGAAYMFITSQYSNGTNVIWQWRGNATGNPSSGSFNSGASITISGC